jgi:hypothetical protein
MGADAEIIRVVGRCENITFRAAAVSPARMNTQLQIVCFFDHTQNETLGGGTAELDERFNGLIEMIRIEDDFRGDFLETLLLTPSDQILAKNLLLVGLGKPEEMRIDRVFRLGSVVIREALKLGVESVSVAPDLQDAGYTELDVRPISVSITAGMVSAILSAQKLKNLGLLKSSSVSEVTLLAGKAHIDDAEAGMKKVLQT